MGNCWRKSGDSSPRRIGPTPSSVPPIPIPQDLQQVPTREDASVRFIETTVLKALVARGDVKLLKASWLGRHGHREGSRLPSRQHLERECPDAFADEEMVSKCMDEVALAAREETSNCKFPALVVVSYCWETPLHPDTRGMLLRNLGPVLEFYASQRASRDLDPDFAVMIDFWCLQQGAVRTEEQQESFQRAMLSMDAWFGHQGTVSLLLTTVPEEWQVAHSFVDRGWPTFEHTVSSLHKTGGHCLDVGKFEPRDFYHGDFGCKGVEVLRDQGNEDSVDSAESRATLSLLEDGARAAPLTAERFKALVARKRFGSSHDRGVVSELYSRAVAAVLSHMERAAWTQVRWEASDFGALGESLGMCHGLTSLSLTACDVSDAALTSFVAAIPAGCPPLLESLDLSTNPIGDDGIGALADAISGQDGAMPRLWDIAIDDMSEVAARSLLAAINSRAPDAVTMIRGRFVRGSSQGTAGEPRRNNIEIKIDVGL